LQNSENCNQELVYHELKKDEKKKIVDSIKTKSVPCSVLIDELRMHRKEVKDLLNFSNKLMEKYEKIKIRQKKQIEQASAV
jgi:hypothetical protein